MPVFLRMARDVPSSASTGEAYGEVSETQKGASSGLPEAEACAKSIAAITSGRALLADPDPAPELTKQLATALRTVLGKLQADLAAAFKAGGGKLAASQVWGRLSD